MLAGGLAEDGDDVGGLEDQAGGRGGEQPGVVVDDVEDLGASAAGELPVGDVQLPSLVGLVGLEPDVAGLGPLAGLRGDESPPGQHPPDCRHRRGAAVQPRQVHRDRGCAGVQALLAQRLAQRDDLVFQFPAHPARAGPGPPGPRLERRLALSRIPGG